MKKKITLRSGLFLAFVLALTNSTAQTTGDYRTKAAPVSLNSITNWDVYNGTAWVAASIAPFGSDSNFVQFGDTSTSTSVVLTAAQPLIRVGQIVTGSGVVVGTTVSAISGTTLTLSNATTTTVPGAALTFSERFSTSSTQSGATSTSTSVTLTAPNSFIKVGQIVTGSGVVAATTVSAISGTALTLSIATTSTVASTTLTFLDSKTTNGSDAVTLLTNTYPIAADMAVTGSGIPNGTKVLSVNSPTSITLSASATTTAAAVSLTFYTKESSATIAAAGTSITLAAANNLVQVGMLVTSIANFTNNYFTNGTTVTSVDATKTIIGLSLPVPGQAYGVIPVIFGYNIIPNLYVNHTANGASNINTRLSTIGNVYVNNAAIAYPNGASGITPENATLTPTPGASSLSIAFKTLNVAPLATVGIGIPAATGVSCALALYGAGNVINNNGTIDFTTANSGVNFGRLATSIITPGNNTITGTGIYKFGAFNVSNSGTNVAIAANCSINNVPAGVVAALASSIGAGASLTINEGYVLSNINTIAAGTLTVNTNGNLILKSSAAGTASLLSTNPVINVTQQRYLSSKQQGWRLLSNPLANTIFNTIATASTITLGTDSTGAYNSTDNTWTSTDGAAAMDNNIAYKVFITGLTGEFPDYATGPSNVTIVNKGEATNTTPNTITTVAGKYYLVANPYTAPVSVASIIGASTGLSTTVAYYDPTKATGNVKVKAGGYTTPTISGIAGSATDVVIPAMGAIFVQASSVGTINVPKTAIFIGTPAQSGTYNHKTANVKVAATNALKLEVNSDGINYDTVALQFKAVLDANSNINFGKLPNSILDAYSIVAGNNMAVSELELAVQTIPLGITSTIEKNYTFKVAENTIPAGFEAVLIDNLLNTSKVLTPGASYDFAIDSNVASKGNARFAINLKIAGTLAVVKNELEAKIQVYPNPSRGQFNISNTLNQKEDTTIEISSLNGQVIHTQKLNSGTTMIQTKSWSAGVYILKATNNGAQTTKKLIIQ